MAHESHDKVYCPMFTCGEYLITVGSHACVTDCEANPFCEVLRKWHNGEYDEGGE